VEIPEELDGNYKEQSQSEKYVDKESVREAM